MCQHPFRISPYITCQFLSNLIGIIGNVSTSFQNITLYNLSISIQFSVYKRKCVNILSEYHPIELVKFYAI